jgi:hypothetical protein
MSIVLDFLKRQWLAWFVSSSLHMRYVAEPTILMVAISEGRFSRTRLLSGL